MRSSPALKGTSPYACNATTAAQLAGWRDTPPATGANSSCVSGLVRYTLAIHTCGTFLATIRFYTIRALIMNSL
eukprot:1182511-Prorocentrum_minimum.AAC.6